ncbi:hypothetical protein G195_001666 [Phytophthora kernoviae 00238/432]|uniref:ABC transporter domain-containing protein n=1 Tax=Phytophthora kernoviae 00238/432 TaxID=1284355 RepID=A0A8J4SFT9_9STRA|nr:hypothetical protein G195_001666 [Phytophthora kernoviae 00238/432]
MTERYTLTSSQKMMVFVLSMSLYGLSNMFTELIPKLQLGPIELSVEYFAFIPLTLCILFHPMIAALGAALGEVIFGELMLGQFGGLGELEKFITFSFAMYVAGRMVSDPRNRRQVGIAAMTGVIIHQFLSSLVDIGKVWIGVEQLEAVPGLAESVVLIEGVGFLNDVLFSGILFALLPALYLVPLLYGKIEPLLGIKPRNPGMKYEGIGFFRPKLILIGVLLLAVAFGAESLSEMDINFAVWETDYEDQYGSEEPVLNGASLELRRGSFTAIIGGNGCGKSTLCKLFNGLIPQFYTGDFSGEVHVLGVPAEGRSVADLSRKIGYVYQDFDNQLVRPTVLDEACFAPLNYGLPNYRELGERALAMCGLDAIHNRYIWELSGGQKHLLALAGALSLDPDILIVDEPVSQLDPQHARLIYECLSRLNTEYGKTIIVIEHHTEFIADFCADVVLMDKGRVLWNLPVKEGLNRIADLERLGIQPPEVTRAAIQAAELSQGAKKEAGLLGSAQRFPVTVEEAKVYFAEHYSSIPFACLRKAASVFWNSSEMFIEDSVRKEVAYFLKNRRIPEAEQQIAHVLERFRLTPLQERDARLLSGGQQRRVTLAIGAAMKPSLMLLDEPTANLDLATREELIGVLDELDQHVEADGTPADVFADESLLRRAGLALTQIMELSHRMGLAAPFIIIILCLGLIGQVGWMFIISLFFGGNLESAFPLLLLTLKLSIVSLASITVFSGMDPERIGDGLLALGMPATFSFSLSYAYRILPVLFGEFRNIMLSYRLRDGLRIFPGMEVDIQETGHILLMGQKEHILAVRSGLEQYTAKDSFIPFAELLDLAEAWPLLKIGAHPFRESTPLYQLDRDLLGRLDAFDLNAKDMYQYGIETCRNQVEPFAQSLGKPVTAGSDTHQCLQYGSVFNVLDRPCGSVAELKEQILAGAYSIEISPDLPLRVKASVMLKKVMKRLAKLDASRLQEV